MGTYSWEIPLCLKKWIMQHSLILKVTVKLDPQNDQLKNEVLRTLINNQLKKRTNNLTISNGHDGYAYVSTLPKWLSITCINTIQDIVHSH